MCLSQIKLQDEDLIKTYKDIISADMDHRMLTVLSAKHLSPAIKWRDGTVICRAYIQGQTILQQLEAYEKGLLEKKALEETFFQLLKWIEQFNEATYTAFGTFIKLTDFHLRNFIVENKRIFGIDFELYEVGKKEDNFIAVLAWLSLYDFNHISSFAWLKAYVETSLKHYIECNNLKQQVIEFCKVRLIKRELYRTCKNITCVILSGGQNKRMGTYKSELKIGQYSFMDHLMYQNSMFKEIILSVNETQRYKHYNQPMVLDCAGQIGPMGGIYSVLKKISTDRFFVCTCDSPYIDEQVYLTLMQKKFNDYDGVVTCINGKINPLLAVYKKRILPQVAYLIANKDYKMMHLLRNLNIQYVEVGHLMPEGSYNLNTPEAYDQFCKQLQQYKDLFALTTEWGKE